MTTPSAPCALIGAAPHSTHTAGRRQQPLTRDLGHRPAELLAPRTRWWTTACVPRGRPPGRRSTKTRDEPAGAGDRRGGSHAPRQLQLRHRRSGACLCTPAAARAVFGCWLRRCYNRRRLRCAPRSFSSRLARSNKFIVDSDTPRQRCQPRLAAHSMRGQNGGAPCDGTGGEGVGAVLARAVPRPLRGAWRNSACRRR